MTEYLIIVAIIAVSAIAITSVTGNHVKVGFGRIAASLQGRQSHADQYEDVDDAMMEGKDMGDFTDQVDRNR